MRVWTVCSCWSGDAAWWDFFLERADGCFSYLDPYQLKWLLMKWVLKLNSFSIHVSFSIFPIKNMMWSSSLSIKLLLAPVEVITDTQLAGKRPKNIKFWFWKHRRARRTGWEKGDIEEVEGQKTDVLSQLSFYSLWEVLSSHGCQNVKIKSPCKDRKSFFSLFKR